MKIRKATCFKFVIGIAALALLLYICKESDMPREPRGMVVMYGRESCSYTRKMLAALKHSNSMQHVHYVDTTTAEGEKQFKLSGGKAVPFFTYKGKTALGYMKPADLFRKLQ